MRTESLKTIIEKEWVYKGIKCEVKFVRQSHRCGYMLIPKKSEFNEIESYDDFPIDVHGGLTYLSNGWLGFDCAHYGDATGFTKQPNEHFWTLEETIKETEHMVNGFLKLTWEKIIKAKIEYEPNWFKKRIKIKEMI